MFSSLEDWNPYFPTSFPPAQTTFVTLMNAKLDLSFKQEWADLCQAKMYLLLVWDQDLFRARGELGIHLVQAFNFIHSGSVTQRS